MVKISLNRKYFTNDNNCKTLDYEVQFKDKGRLLNNLKALSISRKKVKHKLSELHNF